MTATDQQKPGFWRRLIGKRARVIVEPAEPAYRRHLANANPCAPIGKDDWAQRIAPLMGVCPYLPKTRK